MWSNFKIVLLVAGMLITGTLNTITKKLQNDTNSLGIDGTYHLFNHPWFQTLAMFIGETFCLIPFFFFKCKESCNQQKKRWDYDHYDIQSTQKKNAVLFHWIFIVPTIFDLAGTTFGGIGFLYTSASVWQMLRGSIIVFSGILTFVFLKRKLVLRQWMGMIIIMAALSIVGASSMLSKPQHFQSLTTGIIFILLGQLCNSIQMVLEESFLKSRNYPPLQVVGMEGLYGSIAMCLIFVPVVYFVPDNGLVAKNFHDDSIDAVVQMANSPYLIAFMIGYVLSISFYNFFGLSVTKHLSAIHRTLVDACRTICVWVAEIVIYYYINKSYGEGWSEPYSYMQLGGFAMLILGTLIYNVPLPCEVVPEVIVTEEKESFISVRYSDPLAETYTEEESIKSEDYTN